MPNDVHQLLSDIAAGLEGFAFEPAVYTPTASDDDPTPDAIDCRVCMDYGGQSAGDTATFFGPRIFATFLLAEVSPETGGTLVLASPHPRFGDMYRLDAPDPSWQSKADSRWVVLNVTP